MRLKYYGFDFVLISACKISLAGYWSGKNVIMNPCHVLFTRSILGWLICLTRMGKDAGFLPSLSHLSLGSKRTESVLWLTKWRWIIQSVLLVKGRCFLFSPICIFIRKSGFQKKKKLKCFCVSFSCCLHASFLVLLRIIGRAAFTDNHQWILLNNFSRDAYPPEVLSWFSAVSGAIRVLFLWRMHE